MRYGAQYFRHTVVQVANAVLVGVLFYLLRIVLYRSLSPEEYGVFYSLFSFSLVVYPFLSFGFDPGIVPFVTRFREQGDPAAIKHTVLGALLVQLTVGAVFLVVVFMFAEPIAGRCFQTPAAALLVRLLALQTVLLLCHKALFGLLLGLQHVASRNGADLARVAFCLGMTALLLRRGYGYEAAALGYLAGAVAAILVELTAVVLLSPAIVRANWLWRPRLLAEIFNSGKYATIAFGGITLFANMDTVMLTLLLPDYRRPVAAYQIAVPTATIIQALLIAGAANFMPMATTLWCRQLRGRLADGVSRIIEAAFVVVLPGVVLLASFSDVLMAALFRDDLMNGPVIFGILALGSTFLFIAHLGIHLLTGIGQPRAACFVVASALLSNLVLNVILIQWWGAEGAALATVMSYALAAALAVATMKRSLALQIPVKPILSTFVAGAVVFAGAYGIRQTSLFAIHPRSAALLTCVILYSVTLAALETMAGARLRELARVVMPLGGYSGVSKGE